MSVTSYPTLRLKLTMPQALKLQFLPAIPGSNAAASAAAAQAAADAAAAAANTATAATANKVDKSGDVMTGFLTLNANPNTNLQAATKQYVDGADATKVNKVGDVMTGFLTLNANPTAVLHAATKQYVDSAVTAGGIAEAPSDGNLYGRLNATWAQAQPLDGDLTSLAGASATNQWYYRSAANTWAPVTVGATMTFVGGVLNTTAGGGNVIATGTPLVGQWARWTSAATIEGVDASATGFQPIDADLTAIAALSGTNTIYYRSAANTWSPVNVSTGLSFAGGNLTATGTGTAGVSVGFRATKDGATTQVIASGTNTKITFPIEVYDNGGLYNPALSRWIPPAGIIHIDAAVMLFSGAASQQQQLAIYKNGSVLQTSFITTAAISDGIVISVDDVANGTDFYECWILPIGSPTIASAVTQCWFEGHATGGPKGDTGATGPQGPAGTGGAPVGAEYITSTADATLTAERVLTDTATVTWDRTTAGQIKANAAAGGGTSTTISDTPPGSPTNGSLWWESDTGTLWISYNDGTSTQWVAVGGGGSSVLPGQLVLIQRQDVSSAVAQVDFTIGIDATYDEYEMHWYGARCAADGAFTLRISQDAGATWKSGATDYSYGVAFAVNVSGSSGFLGSTGAAYIQLTAGHLAAAGNASNGILKLFTPSNTTYKKGMLIAAYMQNSAGQSAWHGYGSYGTDNNAINGLRVYNLGGNITAGTFNLYGVKK